MSRNALSLLLDQAAKAEQKAGLDFAALQMQLQTYRQQLDRLHEYQRSYGEQLAERSQQGLDAHGFTHFQNFLSRLERASTEQSAMIMQTEQHLVKKRTIWIEKQIKRKSLQLLFDKQRAEAEAKAQRREQVEQDEFCNAQFVRRKSQ